MAKIPFRVLIIDVTPDVSAGTCALFKRAGCIVDVFCRRVPPPLLRNRYCDHWFDARNSQTASFLEELQALTSRYHYDWILPANDTTLRLLNKSIEDESLARQLLPLTTISNRLLLGSKAGLSLLCDKHNITTPSFLIYRDTMTPQLLKESLGFPLLLKIDESAGGRGVYFCVDEASAAKVLAGLGSEKKRQLVCQKYLEGDTIAIEALYKKGTLLGYIYSTVTETMGNKFGISCERRYSECPEIESELSRIGLAFGINGFGTITFICEKGTRQHYLVEADLRPQGWFRYGTFCGVDFSQVIQSYFADDSRLWRPVLPPGQASITIWRCVRDIRNCLHKLDFKGLFRWCVNADNRWRFVTWYDWRMLSRLSFRALQWTRKKCSPSET